MGDDVSGRGRGGARASLRVREGVAPPARRPADIPPGAVHIHWLGQAGFLLDSAAIRIIIDPYLSDSLAEKYRGTRFPHVRMMPPPAAPGDLLDVDWVLATHAHTDHLDPGTLPAIAGANPECRFLVPASAREKALERGVPAGRMVTCNTGDRVELVATSVSTAGGPADGGATSVGSTGEAAVRVDVLPAAHEERELDTAGNDRYLGYVLSFGGSVGVGGQRERDATTGVSGSMPTIYHSGDTVPFGELLDALARREIDLALLPINGRDAERRSHGVPGNMTLDEALDLVERVAIPCFIGHHFDLFDFNTVDRDWAEVRLLDRFPDRLERYRLAAVGRRYELLGVAP